MITLDVQQDIVPRDHRLSSSDISAFQHSFKKELPKYAGEIALAFISDSRIQSLNRIYRHKDQVTDVLSFTYSQEPGDHLGDVVISYDQAVRQAEGGDVRLEIIDLVVHGMLHVLGYDHEEAADAETMFPLQDRLVASLI